MDILKLIDEIEDIIEESSKVPFSRKVMIDSEDIIEIIQEIRMKLPDEVQQASFIKDERERIIGEAKREAQELLNSATSESEKLIKESKTKSNEIIKDAEQKSKEIEEKTHNKVLELTNENDIIRASEEKAEKIIKNAESSAREIRLGALEYADALLEKTELGIEESMDNILKIIKENRKELKE